MWEEIKTKFYYYKNLLSKLITYFSIFIFYYIPNIHIYVPRLLYCFFFFFKNKIILCYFTFKIKVLNIFSIFYMIHQKVMLFFLLTYFLTIKKNIKELFKSLETLLNVKNININLKFNMTIQFNSIIFYIYLIFYLYFLMFLLLFLFFLKIYFFFFKKILYFFIFFFINCLYILLFIFYLIEYLVNLTIIKNFFYTIGIMAFWILLGVFGSYCFYLWFNIFYWIPLQWEVFEPCECHRYYHSFLNNINKLGHNYLTPVESAKIFDHIYKTCSCATFSIYELFFILKPPIVETCCFCTIVYIGFHYNILFLFLSFIFLMINLIILGFFIIFLFKKLRKLFFILMNF